MIHGRLPSLRPVTKVPVRISTVLVPPPSRRNICPSEEVSAMRLTHARLLGAVLALTNVAAWLVAGLAAAALVFALVFDAARRNKRPAPTTTLRPQTVSHNR